MAAMVVQFGLAMIPFGIFARARRLTSATTSGTWGSLRQAELLSITMAPCDATLGAIALEVEPPAEKKTTSSPVKFAVDASSTSIVVPFQLTGVPAERDEANRRSVATGNSLSMSNSRIIEPTRPVAPTTPTFRQAL